MFLNPLAAKTVLDSKLNITLIPLAVQRQVSSFSWTIKQLQLKRKTTEAVFARRLLSWLYHLKQKHHRYQHTVFYFQNFLLCPISSSLLSSLASIDWKHFGLNVKSSAIDEDGDAVLEWENLPPLHPQGVVGGGAGDEVGPMVVFSGLKVMENKLD
ncbi:hypothetical protein Syun_028005 [Stephania yunnanensis]|uniref:Uncharacterized protein n=1 Tax=Stephania yunnanensis TaxID=152371 RepID=A0AAP0EGY7_9MAGN